MSTFIACAKQPTKGSAHTVPLPQAAALPVGEHDVWVTDQESGVDRQAAIALLPSGGFVLVYAQYATGDVDSSRLRQAWSLDGSSISSTRPLAFGNQVEGEPSFAQDKEGAWLYFASSAADLGQPRLWRARMNGTHFATPQRLSKIEGLRQMSQFPRWVSAGADMLLTFRDGKAGPQWLRWSKGTQPGTPTRLLGTSAAYPRVVPMGEDGCFFSYQRPPEGGYMATYYRLSPDCSNWSEPLELSPQKAPHKPDVHDAYALPRRDGGVDVYYVYPSFKGEKARFPVGFDLYRRAVHGDGRLGPEQLLTDRLRFNPFAPSAHRLADGSVLVSFSDIQESGEQGVARARLALFRLEHDAPSSREPG